jgi:TetR/AcrR family transcriptional regulator
MQPVEARHLFFVIWAATQTYADFETQIRAVLGRDTIRPADYDEAARLITRWCWVPVAFRARQNQSSGCH